MYIIMFSFIVIRVFTAFPKFLYYINTSTSKVVSLLETPLVLFLHHGLSPQGLTWLEGGIGGNNIPGNTLVTLESKRFPHP